MEILHYFLTVSTVTTLRN